MEEQKKMPAETTATDSPNRFTAVSGEVETLRHSFVAHQLYLLLTYLGGNAVTWPTEMPPSTRMVWPVT